MGRIREIEREVLRVFRGSATKHEANERAKPILEQASRDGTFLSAILERYLETPGSLDRGNYPVVGIQIALNPWFGLSANCWVPLSSRETHISTKAIHHHGDLLLSTATVFGPGYEHWMFSRPESVDESRGIYRMELLEAAPHPLHHVAFVDAWIAHTPLYPSSLSVTLALWSSRHPVTWRDRVKRLPVFQGREEQLRNLALRLGLREQFALKVPESFDYYPTAEGFQVMRERQEFCLGPNSDHVCSVFHVIQETGNERLSRNIRRAIQDGKVAAGRANVEKMLALLERGTPIAGKLSRGHYGVPHANFTRDDIQAALRVTAANTKPKETIRGRQLAS
jgi:hypothetical protein